MATVPCPHPSLLSGSQDWYRRETLPTEARRVHGYEIRRAVRHHQVTHSYADRDIALRRRKLYEDTVAVLLANKAISEVHAGGVVDQANSDLECRLRQEAEKWELETRHLSSPLQRMMHPSYQAILGMSAETQNNRRDVIRFMLHDLKSNHRDWFLALSYLTQHNPISTKDYGKTSKMVAAWVKWGEEQGLLQDDRLSKRR
jgi:hypothetical protein